MKYLRFVFNEKYTKDFIDSFKRDNLEFNDRIKVDGMKEYDITFPFKIKPSTFFDAIPKETLNQFEDSYKCHVSYFSRLDASHIASFSGVEKNTLAFFKFLDDEFGRIYASEIAEKIPNAEWKEDVLGPSTETKPAPSNDFANSYRGRRRTGR